MYCCFTLFLEKKALGNGSFEDSAFKIEYVPFCKKGFDQDKLQQLLDERGTDEPGMRFERQNKRDCAEI